MDDQKKKSNKTKKVLFWVSLSVFVLGVIAIGFLLVNTYLENTA